MRKTAHVALAVATLITSHIHSTWAQTPTVPEAMPWDVPYGTPLGLDDAHKAIIASVNEAKKHNWKMAISVVDPAGNLIAHATMDGTQYASIPISTAKARTAALFRRPSKVFQDGVNAPSGTATPGQLSLLALNGGVASDGGFPIVINGKLVGAIGASGGIASQDAVTSKAGLDALTGGAK